MPRARSKEVTDTVARFEFAGKVEGAVYGVSTKIEIKGKYRFDLRSKRIDWLAMLVQEDRESSFVEDGIDVGLAPANDHHPGQGTGQPGRRGAGQAHLEAHGGTDALDLRVSRRRLAVPV